LHFSGRFEIKDDDRIGREGQNTIIKSWQQEVLILLFKIVNKENNTL